MQIKALFLLLALFISLPAQAQSVLEGTARAMAPGTFQLLNQEGDGSGYGSAFTASGIGLGGMYTFAKNAAYDSIHKRVYFLAGGHDVGQGARINFTAYDIATNRHVRLPEPPWFERFNTLENNRHGYRLQTIAKGKFYRVWANSYEAYACDIDKENIADIGGANCPGDYPPVIAGGGFPTARGPLEYFPERDSLIYVQSNGDKGVYENNLTTKAWKLLFPSLTLPPISGDGIIATYNPVHRVMLIGGGEQSNRFWTIDAAGALTAVDDSPFKTSVAGVTLAADPVSGKFIAILSGYIYWEFDITKPLGSQWTRRLDLEAGIPQMGAAANSISPVVVVPIPEYGVLMYMGYNKVWLHKPGGIAPTPPPDEPPVPPSGQMTFTEKCAMTGVFSCYDFDNDSKLFYVWAAGTPCDQALAGKTRYSFGRDRSGPGNTVAFVHNGVCIYPKVVPLAHSGAGSLEFTIPTNTWDETSGYFSEVFKRLPTGLRDPEAWVGPGSKYGSVFYFQFYQRFSPEFLNTVYQCLDGNCGGWKQAIFFGDPPDGASSSSIESTINNGWMRGVPTMYGQAGSDSYGVQDVRGCTEPAGIYTEPPCIRYKPDQWMQFTGRIEIRGTTPNSPTSRVQLWVDGQQVVDYGQARVYWGNLGDGHGYGQVLISPFHTRKDPTQAHPTGRTWVDSLIMSKDPIPMDGSTTPIPPPVNLSPISNAGPDKAITLPSVANLVGSSTDDGLPTGTLTHQWSGPPGVSFSAPTSTSTTATFAAAGTYTLALTASDGVATSLPDHVVVTVAPVVVPPPPVGDTTRPNVRITYPANNSTFNTNGPTFYISSSDNVAVRRIELWINNSMKAVLVRESQLPGGIPASTSMQWSERNIPRGTYTVRAIAFDAAGNQQTATITVRK